VFTRNLPAPLTEAPRVLDDLLLYRLARLQAEAGGMVVRLCEGRYGITRREWRVILQLVQEDGLQSSELAQRVQLDRARTSRTVTSLVAKKLVQRETRRGDRRRVALALTLAGRQLHSELFPIVAQINLDLLKALEPSAVHALDAGLRALQHQAEAMARQPDQPRANRRGGQAARRSAGPTWLG
jgi:DNA-binding MarR family transcriptional regulator